MTKQQQYNQVIWKTPSWQVGVLLLAGFAILWAFKDAILFMVNQWGSSDEYGYGYMIPVLAGFFVWQKKNELAKIQFTGSWFGILMLLLGLLMMVLGELATLYVIAQYGFLLSLTGLALALVGWQGLRILSPALILLIFMIPLPGFLYQNLSAELQLISSQLGVAVIRLFGISVYLEGNVIDLGAYKLQVVEACSGLRYLFPLTCLAFIAAYIFRGAMWKKAIIFISSAPITVFMNSFRIGVIGVLVEYGGPGQAEGFLHDFEGWIVFMGCIAILVLEMWVLSHIGKDKLPFSEAFALDLPAPITSSESARRLRILPVSFKVAMPVVVVLALVPPMLESRAEVIPSRPTFAEFPMKFGEWQGGRGSLEQIYIDVLKFEDYIVADYLNDSNKVVNFYVAYYGSQRKGESAHSPRSCIPGGGWKIARHEQVIIPLGAADEDSIPVNRLLIEKGEYKQLVYYWFQGRGRIITNEYLVKWYLFWDALTKNRSDGALVRLTGILLPGEDVAELETRILSFAQAMYGTLSEYIPD